MENIELIEEEIGDNIHLKDIIKDTITVIATGPLTSDKLSKEIIELTRRKWTFLL